MYSVIQVIIQAETYSMYLAKLVFSFAAALADNLVCVLILSLDPVTDCAVYWVSSSNPRNVFVWHHTHKSFHCFKLVSELQVTLFDSPSTSIPKGVSN